MLRPEAEEPIPKAAVKLTDFHTVLAARKVDGSVNKNPVVSRREYLFDAAFTVVIRERNNSSIKLEAIAAALRRPVFTPFLGRRSCPLARPLLDGEIVEVSDTKVALATAKPAGGILYAEGDLISGQPMQLRDVPIRGRNRQFANRRVYVHKEEGGTCS